MSESVLLEVSPPYRSPKTRPMQKSAYRDAVDMQKVLKADATNPDANQRERAYSALVWERLEDRKRILRMKGLPKAVDVSKLDKGRRRSGPATSTPSEPTEPKPGA